LGGIPLFLRGGVLHTIKPPEVFGKKNNIGEIYMDTCHIDRLNMSTEIGKFTCKNKDSFTSSNRNVTKQKKETTANIEILPSKDRD